MSGFVQSPCDIAAARHAACRAGCHHPTYVLLATILASGLAFVDGSVVNVALPAIGRSMAAGSTALQWVVNAYLLPLGALILLGGASGDRFGRRRLLIGGTILFGCCSVGCAFAPGLQMLLASRLLQGIGAAILMPNSLAILGSTFTGEAKGRAIGIWAASGAATGALGPVLGGWLIDLGSWRPIFLLNVPLALGAIWLCWRYVPKDENNAALPLDWLGGGLATIGLGALTWGLTVGAGPGGWVRPAILATVTGVIVLALFVVAEHHNGDRAMMPLALFASRSFVGLTLLTLFLYAALGGAFVLIPFVLINAAQYSAAAAGAALLPLPLTLVLASPIMGRLAARRGWRLPLAIGPLGVAAGLLLATRIGANADYWTGILPAMLVMALGLSGAVAPLTTAVLTSVDAQHTGAASGFNSAVARTGGLIATALLGTVLAANGAALVSWFHTAMLIGAATCVAASASAIRLIEPTRAVSTANTMIRHARSTASER